MSRYVLRRMLLSIFVLWAAVTLTFFVLNSSGDPISDELAAAGATQDQIDDALARFGYDRPLLQQYASFIGKAVVGDFGVSIRFGDDVLSLIAARFWATLLLALLAMAIAIAIAIPLGIAAATKKDGFADRLSTAVATFGQSVPSFVVGPILILMFAVWLKVLPVSGNADQLSLILPAITLGLQPAARMSRLFRASILEVSQSPFVISARARGLTERRVTFKHIVRNSLLPVLTLAGVQFSYMLGGAVIVETVFAWPGLGSLARNALITDDFPLIMGIVTVVAAMVVLVNLGTDLLYRLVDPRIQLQDSA